MKNFKKFFLFSVVAAAAGAAAYMVKNGLLPLGQKDEFEDYDVDFEDDLNVRFDLAQ